MTINSNETPIRLDAGDAEITYLFKGSLIEVVYDNGVYLIRSRPQGINMEQTCWPVPREKNQDKLIKLINRYLNCTCVALARQEYVSPSEQSRQKFNALLESYDRSSRSYNLKVSVFELIGVRTKAATQLELF